MRGRFLPFMLGWAMSGLAGVLLIFTALAALLKEPWLPFLAAGLIAALPGGLLLAGGQEHGEPSRRSSLLTVLLLWLLLPLLGALPYAFGGLVGPLDAFFESMSGFTTTGASVMGDLSMAPQSLLLYRSFTQWLGGIGIIIVFAAIFPQLGVAGRQMFMGEEPGPREDRLSPRLRFASAALLSIYAALTVLAFLAYWLAGLDALPAASFAFSTLAAGGFSAKPEAAGTFDLPVFEFIALLFMLLAGTNFTLQHRAWNGRFSELLRDIEFRTYLAVIGVAGVFLFLLLRGGGSLLDALFQVVSVITTTGYTASGLESWPQQAQLLLLALMFVGGSAGSAAGGIRIMRWLIVLGSSGKEVLRQLHPRAALPLKIGHRLITPEVLRSTTAFFTLYVLLIAVSAFALNLLGVEQVSSLSAALSSVGLNSIAFNEDGGLLDFATLPAAAKAILIFNMYAGRLEIVTLAVLLVPSFWRLPRRRNGARD